MNFNSLQIFSFVDFEQFFTVQLLSLNLDLAKAYLTERYKKSDKISSLKKDVIYVAPIILIYLALSLCTKSIFLHSLRKTTLTKISTFKARSMGYPAEHKLTGFVISRLLWDEKYSRSSKYAA